MTNSKGKAIYTSVEVAHELGLSPDTIDAVSERLYGSRVAYWTLTEAQRICEYIKSISVEEDTKRLAELHDMVESIMGDTVLHDADILQACGYSRML